MDRGNRDEKQAQNQNQNQNQNQQAPGRLHLNFGFTNDPNNFAQDGGRAYPTTPSTFPQPVFPNQYGQRETWGTTTANAQNGYGNTSYFMNNPYPTQYQNLPGQNQSLTPGGGGQQYNRGQGYNNDGTNGLVHQFSHQNLGGNSPRAPSPYARTQSPAQGGRPRTGGSQHGSGVNVAQQAAMHEDELPPRNPEKYADNVYKRSKVSQSLVSGFFKENVQRARDRNQRYVARLKHFCPRRN